MRPRLADLDLADRRFVYPVSYGDLAIRSRIEEDFLSHLSGDFRLAVAFTLGGSIAQHAIHHVIGCCAGLQVIWINAQRSIASMSHNKRWRYWSVEYLI